jgi:hypothetical protein
MVGEHIHDSTSSTNFAHWAGANNVPFFPQFFPIIITQNDKPCSVLSSKLCETEWIGRGGLIGWPIRSPDLTRMDFFFVGRCVKNTSCNNFFLLTEHHAALDEGEWLASRPGRFTLREGVPGIH